jgi:hypothetical protein
MIHMMIHDVMMHIVLVLYMEVIIINRSNNTGNAAKYMCIIKIKILLIHYYRL